MNPVDAAEAARRKAQSEKDKRDHAARNADMERPLAGPASTADGGLAADNWPSKLDGGLSRRERARERAELGGMEVPEAPWSVAEWAVALRFDNPRATVLVRLLSDTLRSLYEFWGSKRPKHHSRPPKHTQKL